MDGWCERYLPKVAASKNCDTFEVLEAEVELLLLPAKQSVRNRTHCMKLDQVKTKPTNTVIHHQGAVYRLCSTGAPT